ncbi:MAG: hypothetical protein JNL79_05400 [Myxococcales bacterium]|nr:hypothetical protein [Myxococcales bacterium]
MGSRERILARRASFVAAALATVSVGCSRKDESDIVAPTEGKPKPAQDAGTEPDVGVVDTGSDDVVVPAICLSVSPRDGGFHPCLSMPRKDAGPPPKPCLKVAPPEDL